jgi:hypothetical protein
MLGTHAKGPDLRAFCMRLTYDQLVRRRFGENSAPDQPSRPWPTIPLAIRALPAPWATLSVRLTAALQSRHENPFDANALPPLPGPLSPALPTKTGEKLGRAMARDAARPRAHLPLRTRKGGTAARSEPPSAPRHSVGLSGRAGAISPRRDERVSARRTRSAAGRWHWDSPADDQARGCTRRAGAPVSDASFTHMWDFWWRHAVHGRPGKSHSSPRPRPAPTRSARGVAGAAACHAATSNWSI